MSRNVILNPYLSGYPKRRVTLRMHIVDNSATIIRSFLVSSQVNSIIIRVLLTMGKLSLREVFAALCY